ncbi:K(+) efflux antiporter 3, chloroplastic [Porphyridium purpureum]|uniref:K(+) efflux antiporter 3, chloroplastic n=1 Tax=Porphyridium purpureum TaxID=35688 RepID=A0A5J4YQT4_PORPP|nr:K(+) efflux antiporter 3, chloroplastic [Porphyridium purpureum]|eukprot:POR1547..scf296_7
MWTCSVVAAQADGREGWRKHDCGLATRRQRRRHDAVAYSWSHVCGAAPRRGRAGAVVAACAHAEAGLANVGARTTSGGAFVSGCGARRTLAQFSDILSARASRLRLAQAAAGQVQPRGGTARRHGVRQSKITMIEGGVLGALQEALELLIATVLVIPLFRKFNLSPVLGFLLSGIVLGPHGLRVVPEVEDIAEIADFGVLFLLFEMGLELSIDRLRKLRKYAFGLGLVQVTVTTGFLGLGAFAMGASVPESVVIGSALTLSSSAFVIQLLSERGERDQRFGTATFGVLLFQDIAVVPLLVLVPLLSTSGWVGASQLSQVGWQLGITFVKILSVMTFVVFIGGQVLKRAFTFVAEAKSPEAFTSLVLLTVLGTAWCTDEAGLSMTLGAFLAGVLLAETDYRSQVMIDIEPFRGLLLGLFFITTGMSMDVSLLFEKPLAVGFLITSLILVKASIVSVVALPFGLTLAESVRVGLILGQGGEFAFVLFALANKLGFLPEDVNNLLIVTVVASMALTPLLADIGSRLAPFIDRVTAEAGGLSAKNLMEEETLNNKLPPFSAQVVVIGYSAVGQVVVKMLGQRFISAAVIDKDISTVRLAEAKGVPALYGDATKEELFERFTCNPPLCFVVTITDPVALAQVIPVLQNQFPGRPLFVRARDMKQQRALLDQGILAMYPEELEASLQLGAEVLNVLGENRIAIQNLLRSFRGDTLVTEDFKRSWAAGSLSSDSESDIDGDSVTRNPAVIDMNEGTTLEFQGVHREAVETVDSPSPAAAKSRQNGHAIETPPKGEEKSRRGHEHEQEQERTQEEVGN